MPSSNKVRKVTSENYPTDAGREGELIFRLVYQQAGCKKPFSRLWLSSMEESAIREGFAHLKPSTEYDALYNAALCRERADWMVGINVSRLFSCLYGQPLAVGRVMTPVLAMTVVREAAIAAFTPEKFYTVDLELTSGCTASSRRIPEKTVAENLLEACRKEMVATIQRITRKEKSENPPLLYDLTTLQRDANRLLGYSAQQTLDYVQALYEKKLTTYPRTDSCYITDDDEAMLEELTEELEGFLDITPEDVDEAVPRTRRTVNREKVTDHHAILPTRSMLQADLDALPKGEQNVLKLIIARTLMAVSRPFRYLETLLTTECAGEEFTAKGKEILEEGWKAVERKVLADILNRKQELTALPNAAENECGILNAELKEGQTSPPKHFTEDTLLSAMQAAGADSMPEGVERQGIGTPATRAATIEKLVQKGFLERKGNKKTKALLPTDKGKALITVMPEEIQSADMTADWEAKLLQIERGEMEPSEFMTEINTMITELVKNTEMKKGVNASVDNMLCVTNDGRKIGLDVRLMNPMLPDDPNSKLNVCVQNVLKIWEDGKDQKLTQLLFCDLSTPKNDGNFNVYDDIRKKLVAAGVPENEIEFIHNADTEAKKAALFSKVRSGDVRVLLGSTAKMGAGTNVQSRLVAVHHLDVGWKPSDMTQRNGRIIRQGNMNKEVKVFNYVTEGTFDSYLYVRHEVA